MASTSQIYIGDLSRDMKSSELRYEFEEFGKIVDFNFKGAFAFCEYETRDQAEKAI